MSASGTSLSFVDVTVTYGTFVALHQIPVHFEPGKIHAVVGQNGAGKTTFARTAAGLLNLASGSIRVGSELLPTGSVNRARAAGVEMVHQSFALPPSFTVAEAMEFGSASSGALFTRRQLEDRWRAHIDELDINVPLDARIRDLPIETQQGLEIARALVMDAKVLILDGPTAFLPPPGIDALFERVRRLKARGVTCIVILHKIREVLVLADTVTVLRSGRLIEATIPCNEVTPNRLASMIVGSQARPDRAVAGPVVADGSTSARVIPVSAPKVLALSNLSTRPDGDGPALDSVSLELRAGEIVGVAGVEGNGQRTLVRAIAKLAERSAGRIELGGVDVSHASLTERRIRGLRIIPFERNVEGLSLSSSLWENWASRELLQGSLLRLLRPSHIRAACDAALQKWAVRYQSNAHKAGSLSGGNAQKVILAREVDPDAKVILAAQPTRGLDVGATAFVWKALRDASAGGSGILVISSDLDELFDISDRIVVMLAGRVVGEFIAPYDLQKIGEAMTGAAS